MNIQSLLQNLTSHPAVSGFEHTLSHYLSEILQPYCDEITVDNMGNVIGRCIAKKTKHAATTKLPSAKHTTIMIEAHIDQVGLMVTKIEPGGFLRFAAIGSIDERILPGSEVYVGPDRIYGVIGHKPPHILNSTDKCDIKNMYIDTGLSDAQSVIQPGDFVTFYPSFTVLRQGFFSSPAMDNRASIAAILCCAEDVIHNDEYDLYICFTVSEELGLVGAYSVVDKIKPDFLIAVDVTYGQGIKDEAIGLSDEFNLGSGAVICKGPGLKLGSVLINTARELKIPYCIEVAPHGSGTTADVSTVPTGLISIPLRYMHTTVETVCQSDILSVAKLLNGFLNRRDWFENK